MITAALDRAAARGWSSGASGTGIADGVFEAWRGSPVGVTATWADTDSQTQEAASIADYASWQGDLDIAVGGTAVNSGETYAQAADGTFDARWRTAARNIEAARGSSQSTTYVRPWHESNGSWYANWQVTGNNVGDYKKAFARYVGILRTECPHCVIVWSPNDGTSPGSARPEEAYPGDDVVDVVGVDSYNGNGNPVVTDETTWADYANAGTETDPAGVETWRTFAERHGKPIAFPEWGLNPDGGDAPEYIKYMNGWMAEHAAHPGDTSLSGKVLYDVYFNVNHEGKAGFKIKDGPNIKAGEAYQSLAWGAQTSASAGQGSLAAEPGSLTAGEVTLTTLGIDRDSETLTNQQYVAGGSGAQTLDLYLPKRTASAVAIPLVVFIHGGAFSGGDKSDVDPFTQAFLAKGYAVAGVNYRLSGDAPFPAGAQDAKAAIRWLRANAPTHGIDPGRIGAFGTSAGGFMAAMLGVSVSQQPSGLDDDTLGNADVSSAVQAVASLYGPTDFLTMNAQIEQAQCMNPPQDHDAADSPESVWLRSPVQTSSLAAATNLINWIPTAKPGSIPPFLFVHGTADCLVPHGQSEELAAALHQAGIQADVDLVDGADHGGSAIDVDKQPELVAFFDRTLAATGQT